MSAQRHLGLVCITHSDDIRFKTITRTRYLTLTEAECETTLRALYENNLNKLFAALEYCRRQAIRLYRMSANLFPLSDWEDGIGAALLHAFKDKMAGFGKQAAAHQIRVVIYPEQFVVLNSEKEAVVTKSIGILEKHASIMDRLRLERNPWAAINIHGGKGRRPDELVDTITNLNDTVKSRLTLENDERSYGARDILDVCQRAGVPMVFDAHHHLVRERLESYENASIAHFTNKSRKTWQPQYWQLVHLSNGRDKLLDNKHSDLISSFPSAFKKVTWIEVEAKAKEKAILQLRENL